MVRYYEKPILMIEFDDKIPFRLSKFDDGLSEKFSLQGKIAGITMHYKKLQVIYTKNPAHSAEIMHKLKEKAFFETKVGELDLDLTKVKQAGKLNYELSEDDDFTKFLPERFLKNLGVLKTN